MSCTRKSPYWWLQWPIRWLFDNTVPIERMATPVAVTALTSVLVSHSSPKIRPHSGHGFLHSLDPLQTFRRGDSVAGAGRKRNSGFGESQGKKQT